MSGKIGSSWVGPSLSSASSASVVSAPPMMISMVTPPSRNASTVASSSAHSILKASHTNCNNNNSSSSSSDSNISNNSNSNSNPVIQVATKLNKIMGQGLFACTSPDVLLMEDELLMSNHHQAVVVLPTGRMRQKAGMLSLFTDDEQDNNNCGIEIDRENSLRPAYDLYRV
jgi:hypothetical protein